MFIAICYLLKLTKTPEAIFIAAPCIQTITSIAGWFRAILPKSALIVEEEAWNAYPYTKTIYRCPFIEKFVLEIETVYHNDDGHQENVFNLSSTDLASRTVGMFCSFVRFLTAELISGKKDVQLSLIHI